MRQIQLSLPRSKGCYIRRRPYGVYRSRDLLNDEESHFKLFSRWRHMPVKSRDLVIQPTHQSSSPATLVIEDIHLGWISTTRPIDLIAPWCRSIPRLPLLFEVTRSRPIIFLPPWTFLALRTGRNWFRRPSVTLTVR